MPRCEAVTNAGGQCFGNTLPDSHFCNMHDPRRRAEMQEARKRGARTTNGQRVPAVRTVEAADTPGPIETLEDVATWLRWLTLAVTTGKIDARTCREATAALKELRPTLVSVGIEGEVRELRAELRAAKGTKP